MQEEPLVAEDSLPFKDLRGRGSLTRIEDDIVLKFVGVGGRAKIRYADAKTLMARVLYLIAETA